MSLYIVIKTLITDWKIFYIRIIQNGYTMKTVLLEEFTVKGHKYLTSTHKSTLEFTSDSQLTLRGTCILGMESPKSCSNLKNDTKQKLRDNNKFLVTIQSSNYFDDFIGFGHPNLILTHAHDMVFRKSTYICTRTILIACTKAASDINRDLVKYLQNPSNQALIQIYHIIKD